MKASLLIFFSWILLPTASFAANTNLYEWGPTIGSFQMSIRLKDGGTELKSNQPIDLMVRIKNSSTNETLKFVLYNGQVDSPSNFSLSILSPSGKDIYVWHSPVTPGGEVYGNASSVIVPPGGVSEFPFRALGLSESLTNGVYTIVARKKLFHGQTGISNTLLLNVVPGEWIGSGRDSPFQFP